MIIKRESMNYATAFLKNIIFKGRHRWKFRFGYDNGSAPFSVGLWRCDMGEIGACDLVNYIGKYERKCYVYDSYALCKNIYDLADEWSEDNSYGLAINDGGVIEMHVDFDALTLSFSINGIEFGVSHNIKDGKYRAAVSISAKNTKIELLSYTKHEGNDDEETEDEDDEDKPILSR
eukprot:UN06289